MKKTLFALCLCLLSAVARAQGIQYTTDDSLRIVQLLQHTDAPAPIGEGGMGALMLHYGRALMLQDIPYVAHTLEPNDREQLIINMRQMDCTTFVENVLALVLCRKDGLATFDAFCHVLQKIRYEQGDVPAYTRRLHYFTTWIADNTQMGFCQEVQSPNPPFTAVQTVRADYMSKHPDRYRMLTVNPQDIAAIRDMERQITGRQYRYIPKHQIANTRLLRQTVHDGDIIAIITNIAGLDTQHIGIAAWHADGLHLLNASSIHKKIVEEPMTLRQYLYKHPTMPGIRIIRVK